MSTPTEIGEEVSTHPMFASFAEYTDEGKKDTVFKSLSSHELADVLQDVGRRLLSLRNEDKDASFWYDVLMRVGKYLRSSPELNELEKNMIRNAPDDIKGVLQAAKHIQKRSGRTLRVARDMINQWLNDNPEYKAVAEKQKSNVNVPTTICHACKGVLHITDRMCRYCYVPQKGATK